MALVYVSFSDSCSAKVIWFVRLVILRWLWFGCIIDRSIDELDRYERCETVRSRWNAWEVLQYDASTCLHVCLGFYIFKRDTRVQQTTATLQPHAHARTCMESVGAEPTLRPPPLWMQKLQHSNSQFHGQHERGELRDVHGCPYLRRIRAQLSGPACFRTLKAVLHASQDADLQVAQRAECCLPLPCSHSLTAKVQT